MADTGQSFATDNVQEECIPEDDEDDLSTNEGSFCDPSQYLAFLNWYREHVGSHQEDRDFFMSTIELESTDASDAGQPD